MEITKKLLLELQNRLKVGSRRGVHLNAIPARSRYKFDLTRLSHIDEDLPQNFINALLSEQPLKFKVSWKDNVPDLNSLFEDDQVQLVKITKSFENLINQTDAIESEKGINTFGFGFPLLVRRDQSDKKLTVAPILIWSLKIKRTKEFNTWVILRDENDPVYINEVLINHLQSDSKIEINPVSPELLDDGVIDKKELIDICVDLIKTINSTTPNDLHSTFKHKLENIKSISDKKHYEKLPLTSSNSFIDFSGLFSIFEVQKQNIIHDYVNLLDLEGTTIDLEDMEEHSFQPISSVETDPSQQSILHSLKNTRNILIQGPPGTGKSQSLTAILINALENNKKTIVVCEKITALNVLKEALDKRGLSNLNVQITEVQKSGRRNAVYSVRDRIENTQYRRYRYTHSKETLDNIIDNAKSLINSINEKHLKLGEKLIGNKNWTHIVGEFLSEQKGNEEEYNLNIEKGTFKYDSTELNDYLELIRKGHNLYNNFKPNKDISFLNSSKLLGDNPYLIEQRLKDDFSNYKSELESILKNRINLLNESEYLSDDKMQANALFLKWLISNHKNDTLKDLKIISLEKSSESSDVISRVFPSSKHLLLTPKSFLKTDFPLYSDIIREKDRMHPIYNKILDSAEFKWLDKYGFIHYSPLVKRKEKLDSKTIELLIHNSNDLSLIKDDEGKITCEIEMEFSDLAYLTSSENHIYDRNSTTSSSLKIFNFLLNEATIKDTYFTQNIESITVGDSVIEFEKTLWLKRSKSIQWVNVRNNEVENGNKFSKEVPSSKNLSELIKDNTELINTIRGEKQISFLSKINVGVSDLIRNTLASDEIRISWDKALTNMITSNVDPELVQEIFSDPGIQNEYKKRLNERKLISRNQKIGALIEQLFNELINKLKEKGVKINIIREPFGSDYFLTDESSDLVNDKMEKEVFKINNWLIELKATGRNYAAMTSLQAKTATENKDNYALIVVPLDGSEPDIEYVQTNAKVVGKIGYRLSHLIKDFNDIESKKTN